MSDALVNKGMLITGQAPADGERKPIVVIGAARGGTSMVAGALAKLGVFMGNQAVPPVYEDVRLAECFEQRDFEAARAIADEYSGQHPRWGWKRPSAIDYLADVDRVLDHPEYIFIYKDVFSIAQRNAISMLSDFLPSMDRAIAQYAKSAAFLREYQPWAMLVSYDKTASNADEFVDMLIRFAGLSPSEDQRRAAVDFVRPNPEDYLDASRITKAQGRLGGVAGRVVFGWARYVYRREAAEVQLFLNDQPIGAVVADQERPDLKARFNQNCAYKYTLPPDLSLNAGDVLRARVSNEVRDLENSPLVVQPA